MSAALRGAWLGALVLAMSPTVAEAWCQSRTEQAPTPTTCAADGAPLAWWQPCLTYAVDARGSTSLEYATVEQIVDASFEAWLDVDCAAGPLPFTVQPLQPSMCRQAQFNGRGNVNTVGFPTDWVNGAGDPLDPMAFAVTSVWHDPGTGEIFDADILMNESLGPYAPCPDAGCPDGNPGPADLQSIMTHEVGHYFGLGHSAVAESTMFFRQRRQAVSARVLDADDIEGLCAIYPPNATNRKCNFHPQGGLDLDCEDASNTTAGCVTRQTDGSCGELPPAPKSGCSITAHHRGHTLWPLLLLALWLVRRRA